MRHEPLVRQIVPIRQILARTLPFRLAVLTLFDDELAVAGHELPLHVAAKVEIAAMGDSFELAELTRRQKRKRILNIRSTARIMAQLVFIVLAQPQSFARQ